MMLLTDVTVFNTKLILYMMVVSQPLPAWCIVLTCFMRKNTKWNILVTFTSKKLT